MTRNRPNPQNQRSLLESIAGFRAATSHLLDGLNELEQLPSHLMLADVEPGTRTATDYLAVGVKATDLRRALGSVSAQLDLVDALTQGSERDRLRALSAPFDLGLRASAAQPVSLAAAVALIRTRLDALVDFVARIDQVWLQNLSRLDAANKTLNRLDAEVASLGIVEPLLGRTRQRVEHLKDLLMTDPLAAEADVGAEIDRLVADAARHVSMARLGRDNLDSDLADTEVLLANLRVLRSRAHAALDESRAKLVDVPNPVVVPAASVLDGQGGLAEQLDDVNEAMGRPQASSQPDWAVQRSRLDNWLRTAKKLEAQLTDAVERNGAGLARRHELRGAFGAFEAKMAALGRAEDPQLMDTVDEVWNELYTAPTHLDRAADGLARLANALRSTPAADPDDRPSGEARSITGQQP